MPKRIQNLSLDEDDGGLRFPRTMEQAFGFGRSYQLCATCEPEDERSTRRLVLRTAYILSLLLMAGVTWGYL